LMSSFLRSMHERAVLGVGAVCEHLGRLSPGWL
jgi:hypothetical protein